MKRDGSLKTSLSGIKTLVAMQLKETLSLSFKADPKRSLTKLILYVVGIAAITGVLFAVLTVLGMLGLFGAAGYIPMPMWNVVFFTLILLNFLACWNKVTDSLYFSSDNQVLLTYPVPANHVYLSKIIVFLVGELMRSAFSLWPLLLSFGIAYSMPWYFFPWTIVVVVMLSLLPVAISSLLSVPLIYIKTFLKKFPMVRSLLTLGVLVALTVLLFRATAYIPEDLQIAAKWPTVYFPMITDFCRSFQNALSPLIYLSHLAVGYTGAGADNPRLMTVFTGDTAAIFFVILAIIVVLLVLSFFLAKPFYFKMASKTFEFDKQAVRHDYRKKRAFLEGKTSRYLVPKEGISYGPAKMKALLDRLENKHIPAENHEEAIAILSQYVHEEAFVYSEGDFPGAPCFVYVEEEGTTRLTYVEPKGNGLYLYAPGHSHHQNHRKPGFFSFLFKEITVDLRSYQALAGNYLLFVVAPVAVLILNVIFEAMRKSFAGQMYTMVFNALVCSLIILSSNVAVASIFSREGETAYQLRANPTTFGRALLSKLFLRFLIMTGSTIFAVIVYANHCSMSYMRMDLFFFCVYFLYLGHLLWSAELDYMNPQVRLYNGMGSRGAINPNEAKSSALAFILAAVFTGAFYLFASQSMMTALGHLLAACIVFFLARAGLFYWKLRAYGTSTYEGRDKE